MGIKILKTAAHKAAREIKNSYFEGFLDTSDEWIKSRTGISKRNFVTNENTAEMAVNVANELKTKTANFENLDIKVVLHASFSPDLIVPAIAAKIQKELALGENILCADINMGCTGFVGSLIMAERYLKDGEYGIIIASETISDYLNFEDRSTAVLFGDGAAGIIFQKRDGILFSTDVRTFGNDEDLFMMKHGKVAMRGNNVYRFAIDKVPKSIDAVLLKSGISKDEIIHVICHQANIRILEQLEKHTGIQADKFYSNLERYGNTSAASVPLLLNELAEKDIFKANDKLLVIAFGAGLTVASIVMEWN